MRKGSRRQRDLEVSIMTVADVAATLPSHTGHVAGRAVLGVAWLATLGGMGDPATPRFCFTAAARHRFDSPWPATPRSHPFSRLWGLLTLRHAPLNAGDRPRLAQLRRKYPDRLVRRRVKDARPMTQACSVKHRLTMNRIDIQW